MGEVLMLLAAMAGVSWIAYAVFAWNVGKRLQGADHSSPPPAGDITDELTVLIPCRNEAEALPYLLNDLQSQSHPVRIVVIDDGSTDGTRSAAEAAGVRCIPAEDSGKKSALATGFKHVQTPWFATVDADVRLGEDWAHSLLSTAVRKKAACVLGGVVVDAAPSTAWNRFQQLEFAVMQTWIAGGVQSGQLAMGSGANSLYATAHYPVDALQPERASGDDAFALLALREANKPIQWCERSEARVLTSAAPSWKALWQQRARWASKTGGQDADTRRTAFTIAAVHAAPVALAIGAVVADSAVGWGMLIGFIAAKAFVDWRLLAIAGCEFEIALRARDVALFPLRYAILVWGAWWQLLRGRVEWKGRRI
jgi:cellulose synthase/poly-beta-1,6-N-acetylglucosamine synthase-like glycosyltransferase